MHHIPPDIPDGDPRQSGLAVVDVTKSWGPRLVIDALDLTVAPGRVVRVSGENGAGKTTLLRVVAGVVRPDRGRVVVAGREVDRHRRWFLKQLGYLSAGDRGLYPRLSPRTHLQFCAGLALMDGDRQDRAIVRVIDDFGLEPFVDRQAQRLSLGQRQRLKLAMAFLHEPTVVLLDEPTSSLDEHGIGALRTALVELRRRGGFAVCCVPKGIDEPLDFDETYALEAGRLGPE